MISTSFCSIGFQKDKWGRERRVEKPLAEIIPILADAGFDGVEVWYPHIAEIPAPDAEAVRSQIAARRLAVPMLSSYYDFTSTDDTCAASTAHALEVVARAAWLKAAAIRIFTGKTGSAEATPAQWDRAVAALQTIADVAARHNVRLACETHGRNLMDTAASSLELIRRVDRKNVGLILQPSTFKGDYLAACEQLAPHAFHVHATNSRDGKGSALADGDMDYRRIIPILRNAGFSGFVSIEWMGEDPAGMAAREGSYLRDLLGR